MLETYEPQQCKARSKQAQRRCRRRAIPFGDLCTHHGGNRPLIREKARLAMLDYEMWTTDPPWKKGHRIRQWKVSNDRWEMRKARRAGPEFVAALLAERAAAKAEKEAEYAENRRVADERREARKREHRPEVTPAEPDDYDDEDMERWSRW